MITEKKNYCSRPNENEDTDCYSLSINERYFLYDVNPPEGFNLRRDVFMRVAVLIRKLRKYGNWTLVLPPWDNLYHWRSDDVGGQRSLPWALFFDLDSIKKFIPVIEFEDFIKDESNRIIDEVFFLQNYKDAWESNNWEDKMDIEACIGKLPYSVNAKGEYKNEFWGHGSSIKGKRVRCLSFQGPASYIIPLLVGGKRIGTGKKGWVIKPDENIARTVMVDRAEIMLHDEFGSPEYWRARRSMRFAHHLVAEAKEFRKMRLNSTDIKDETLRPLSWMDEKPQAVDDGFKKGGPYLCVHMRRMDFVWGRTSEVPTVKWAAQQVKNHLKRLNLVTVFLATDAPEEEIEEFQQHIGPNYDVVHWKPSIDLKAMYKDGGVAIIEQIICSHSRFFVGTHESTFSFRIQEEREIMGFNPDSTFNRLCGGDGTPSKSSPKKDKCEKPSRWRIAF
ncbi:hypothetical protein J437_LFUL010396 [Ladona fulva]|uniref:GDP-fucose protein O-fucosyltransferase 2 n=1 Tax=Ladona fulva TaxID=123851 RepID=A0A8K0KAF7_LADFU|nr:hypothetical protein J437_LFUL010396 [Ladona fulva]